MGLQVIEACSCAARTIRRVATLFTTEQTPAVPMNRAKVPIAIYISNFTTPAARIAITSAIGAFPDTNGTSFAIGRTTIDCHGECPCCPPVDVHRDSGVILTAWIVTRRCVRDAFPSRPAQCPPTACNRPSIGVSRLIIPDGQQLLLPTAHLCASVNDGRSSTKNRC